MGVNEYKALVAFLVLCLGFFLVREFTLKDKALSKIEDMTKLITELETMVTETRMLVTDMRMWAMERFVAREPFEQAIKELWEELEETREETPKLIKACKEQCPVKSHCKS